jgi:hypothetical protein
MSTNKDLFKEAIADAKQVREAALANAKAALEEALSPKLQSMISAKLQEMELEEDDIEEIDYMQPYDTSDEQQNTGFGSVEQGNPGEGDVNGMMKREGDEDLEEDFDLSAILAELDEEDSLDEAKKKKDEDEEKKEVKEAKDESEDEDEESEEDEESDDEEEVEAEDEKITDLTVDQLKDLIKDVISAELDANAGDELGVPGDELEMGGGEEEMSVDMGDAGEEVGVSDEEEVDLEELLAELDALDEADDDDKDDMYEAKKKDKKEKEEKDEMKEAIDTINALRNELNEVNLLNAKLLYVNKIFKAKNLNESQKLKVIASFDKATTPAQAKELFESIEKSNFGAKKTQIKESLGFASKAAGVAPKATIVESNDVITRMQKLANIIK